MDGWGKFETASTTCMKESRMWAPGEGHAEDAVELGGHEGEAGLRHRLGERLRAHRQPAHLRNKHSV